ncbi:MAG TPA: hypothetical protein VMR21_08495 [Vicinamibacteria bacterium]|nr:hypothetical protein [Vicinamibacteria bacterium]
MPSLLKLPDIWRVIREVDLEAIRRDAEGRFRILVLAATRSQAEAMAVLLTGEDAPHPWLELRTPSDLDSGRGEVELAPDEPATLTAALIVTGLADLGEELATAGDRLRRAGVPVATVVHGGTRAVDGVVRTGEDARTVVVALDQACVGPVAEMLVGVVDSGRRLALARQLPPVREAVFDRLIEETAKANATYAFTAAMAESVPVLGVPLNLADMAILTKNQLLMGYKIALGAGKSGRARELIGEVLGVVGGGFLFRQAARQLVGLIPVAGVLPKVAIAYTGTWAIGRAVVVWATQGRRLSPRTVSRFSKDAAGRGRAFARGLISRRDRSAAAQ